MKPVKVVLKDQFAILDKFYMQDETVFIPLWYAKLLRLLKICSIKEFDNFDKTLNQVIADQNINKKTLIKIPRDFYFLAYDIIRSLKNGKYQERVEKLIEFKELRQRIIIKSAEKGLINEKMLKNMAFEEGIFYSTIINTKNNVFFQINQLKLTQEDDE